MTLKLKAGCLCVAGPRRSEADEKRRHSLLHPSGLHHAALHHHSGFDPWREEAGLQTPVQLLPAEHGVPGLQTLPSPWWTNKVGKTSRLVICCLWMTPQDRSLGERKLISGILGASVANLSIKALEEHVVFQLSNPEPKPVSPKPENTCHLFKPVCWSVNVFQTAGELRCNLCFLGLHTEQWVCWCFWEMNEHMWTVRWNTLMHAQ